MSLQLRTSSEFQNTYFVAGERIYIGVTLTNEEELKKCCSISCLIQAVETADWHEAHTVVVSNGKTSTTQTVWHHYHNKRVLYEIPYICWRANGTSESISTGSHSYDFELKLPTSMTPSSCKTTKGHITFTVYAILNQEDEGIVDSFLSFFGVSKGLKSHVTFDFVGKQANQEILDDPQNHRHIVGSREKTFWLKSGKMCITAVLNKRVFLDDEIMELDVVVQNGTSNASDMLNFVFMEKMTYKTPNKTAMEENILSNISTPFIVGANKRSQQKFKLLIPKGILESTTDPNAIVVREYVLVVRVPVGIQLTAPTIAFNVIVVNQFGCTERTTWKNTIQQTPRYLDEEDGFEVVEENTGFLDDYEIEVKNEKNNKKKVQSVTTMDDTKE
jgi:hypothetical protein